MRLMLNSGRSIVQGTHVENKTNPAYSEETSSCFLNPLDLMDLEIDEEEHVLMTSEWGSVVLKARASEDVQKGMVFVPYGPYINHIIPAGTHSTGMPDFKGIMVDVAFCAEKRVSVWDLMETIGGLRYEDS
jgi:formylmethanofuran dehydrogenase subunit D